MVGDEFEYSYSILCFAVFSTICSGFNTSANSILLAQANHKLLSAISFCIVAFNIPMSIYLGLEYGLIGIAMSGALTNLIFNIYVKKWRCFANTMIIKPKLFIFSCLPLYSLCIV